MLSSDRGEIFMCRAPAIFILTVCSALAQPVPAKLVALDIAAVGARGDAIPDLSSSEIKVLDNKRAQPIIYWRSNNRRPDIPHVTVVLFSLEYAGIKSSAWDEAVETMRRYEGSEYLYLYAVTGRGVLLPIHALPPSDASSAPVNLPWMNERIPQFESAGSLQESPWNKNDPQYRGATLTYAQYATLNYAQEITTKLAAFPGRKNLICIGCLLFNAESLETHDNVPGAPQSALATTLRQLAGAFNQARVAVYPVGEPRQTYLASQVGTTLDVTGLDRIDAISRVTGGRAYAQGEIEHAITQAINDGRSSFRIGYLPPPDNWDGKTHQIRIACKRTSVRVLAPSWYFADSLDDVIREWKQTIPDYVVTSPFDQSDIEVSVSHLEKAADAVRLQVRVNAEDVTLVKRNERYTGTLALQALCYEPDGRWLGCTERLQAKLDLSQKERDTAIGGGLRFPLSLPSRDVSAKIRIVVYDAISGAAGSSTVLAGEMH
jgi:hypothetical protein